MFYLFAPVAQKRVAFGSGRLGSSVELFDPTYTFTPNPSSPPSPLMAGLASNKTPAPPPSPIANRFGIGIGRAIAAPPELLHPVNSGHRSVSRSASAAGGLLGPSGPTKHPPPSPSSQYRRERMDSASSVSGNHRGSGGDISLRQLDAELGRGFVIITLDIFAPHTDIVC